VLRIAADHGVFSCSVIGNDRLMEFSHDGMRMTLPLSSDLETFRPHAVMRLIDFFSGRLSTADFWPEGDAASA
jgi:hypothetical protein